MAVVKAVQKGMRAVFGSRNDRLVKAYRKRVDNINALEPEYRKLTDDQLRERSGELRQRLADGEDREAVQPHAFALMREALDRFVGIRNIFSVEHREAFDAGKLPSELRADYERICAEVDAAAPVEELGHPGSVPAHLLPDVPHAFYDAVREVYPKSRPPFRCRPFDVQLIGGMVLSEGRIAEMKTGEGKTIVAPLACFMAVTEGLQCHVVTVNDYLVQRDRDWVFPAFYKLGVTVGAIHPYHMLPEPKKKEMYDCDIVYGTNSEFGFDYLRDNMKLSVADQVQKRRGFCIVDEIDSILIDEARTPLIISGPAHDDAPQYLKADEVARQLKLLQQGANSDTRKRLARADFAAEQARVHKVQTGAIEKIIAKFKDLGPDYLDEKEADQIQHVQYYVSKKEQKQASMTAIGVEEAQRLIGTRFYVVGNDMGWDHLINNAIRAHAVYERDGAYVVQDGEVVIVDEFTGRLMIGRQWSDGLHQAVEAKEGVKIKKETQTLATVTIQNFFKLYERLAGMTGTAVTEATEFDEIYGLDVVCIPTNVPVIRDDAEDLIFLTEKAKWNAIVDEINHVSIELQRPVLVGTTSVDKSEMLGRLLEKRHGIDHEVLNAKQHEREANIVEDAGQQHVDPRGRTVGNVVIATNMAGRGTDIKLPQHLRDAGGLHIIGTERHESRRIDNQLRGRAGRQGDPGSSRFFISMEDDLMKMFAGKATMKALSVLGMQEDDAIEHKWITKSVERAQSKVEERNFQIRKNLLEYDEVMEYQRNSFYGTRQTVLEGRDIKPLVFEYIAEAIEDAVGRYLADDYVAEQVADATGAILNVNVNPNKLRGEKLDDVDGTIRSDAKAAVSQDIEISVGEYMDEAMEPEAWDLKGLASWAMKQFSVDLKMNKLREMSPTDVMDELTVHAHKLIDRRSLDALDKYFERDYAASELAAWARAKFGLELTPEELAPNSNERATEAQQRVGDLIYERARAAYERREIEYPVGFNLEMVFGAAQQGADGTAWAADRLVRWANHRYEMGWDAETITSKGGDEIHRELVDAAEKWHGEKLDAWIEAVVRGSGGSDNTQIAKRFEERWGVALDTDELDAAPDVEEFVRDRAALILRSELTQLEQYVLLQILDQSWKDHLYAMDQLKDSIGLRGFAEKDPKIEYKAEGARMFGEMQVNVRDKVTDLIFKAKLTANVQMQNVYAQQQARHEVDENLGAGSTIGTEEQNADLAAAQRAGGGERQVVETIVRDQPAVGRNDPCPCGSGKKYKKCCGANG